MSDSKPLLAFDGVTISARDLFETDLDEAVHFELRPGELALIEAGSVRASGPFCDLAQGLVEPERGRVRFRGQDWVGLGAREAASERGRIGRFFARSPWISNLDTDENVLLPGLHHGRLGRAALEREAESLAVTFGLDRLPRLRPAVTPPTTLHRAQLVRVFLGEPDLILLELPEAVVSPADLGALAGAVETARARGAAVVWLTGHGGPRTDISPAPTASYKIRGVRLTAHRQPTGETTDEGA